MHEMKNFSKSHETGPLCAETIIEIVMNLFNNIYTNLICCVNAQNVLLTTHTVKKEIK